MLPTRTIVDRAQIAHAEARKYGEEQVDVQVVNGFHLVDLVVVVVVVFYQ